MGATTIGAVSDRINSVVASQGFTRSKDAFDFDRLPSQALDLAYTLQAERQSGPAGMLGSAGQEEQHRITIMLARKIKQDPHGALRQLQVDMDLIEGALWDDVLSYGLDYTLDDDSVEGECRLPSPDSEHVVAQLSAVVLFERTL